MADHFGRVVATDASAEQIANAKPHDGVEFRVAPAESSGLPDKVRRSHNGGAGRTLVRSGCFLYRDTPYCPPRCAPRADYLWRHGN
ncbi:MAG TPA: hypothetical protein VKA94_01200 [Hyphomicrobiales bacterium]|nr:hypothetical protein [Hyphomicrobiales bacterium]